MKPINRRKKERKKEKEIFFYFLWQQAIDDAMHDGNVHATAHGRCHGALHCQVQVDLLLIQQIVIGHASGLHGTKGRRKR